MAVVGIKSEYDRSEGGLSEGFGGGSVVRKRARYTAKDVYARGIEAHFRVGSWLTH